MFKGQLIALKLETFLCRDPELDDIWQRSITEYLADKEQPTPKDVLYAFDRAIERLKSHETLPATRENVECYLRFLKMVKSLPLKALRGAISAEVIQAAVFLYRRKYETES